MTMTKDFEASKNAKAFALAHVEPWNDAEKERQRVTAHQCLTGHDCGEEKSRLSIENCGACVLDLREVTRPERKARMLVTTGAPNYAGWLRVYIEGRKEVPLVWYVAEMSRAKADNPAYYNAILRSIATFGIYLGK